MRGPWLGLAIALLALGETLNAQQPVLPPGVSNKPGFPKILTNGKASHGEPVVADLGLTPGHKSIIFGTSADLLYVVEYDGTVAPGFPVTLPGDVMSSPAIGDIDGDGIPDIVVGYGSYINSTSPGGVAAYRRDGTQIWNRPSGDFSDATGTGPDGIPDPVESTPAIGDIDGDGSIEVAWGSLDANVYVVDGKTGNDKPGWPHFVRDTIYSSPALADLDGNGKLEVIIGVDAHLEGSPYNTPNGGCLHAFRYDATEVPGFPQCIDQVIISSPAVGDINGDGKPEIVVGTGRYYTGRMHRLYAFRCDGTALPGWPVTVDGQVTTAPALADLDGDGVLDVVATDEPDPVSSGGPYKVYGFKGDGTLLWKQTPTGFFGVNGPIGNPVVADILGDGNVEVIVPMLTELVVFTKSGTQLTDNGSHTTYSLFAETTISSAVIMDFESDGVGTEIAALSGDPFPSATNTQVYVWTTKVSASTPWPMFRQNPLRLGVAPGSPSCAGVTGPPNPINFYTLTPCRIIDTRNAPGPYGSPPLSGQATRFFVIAGQCGIPADAQAVSLNVTITGANAAGDLRLFPGSTSPPPTSIINFSAGQTRANNAVIGLSLTGVLGVRDDQPTGQVQLIIDTNGYFK